MKPLSSSFLGILSGAYPMLQFWQVSQLTKRYIGDETSRIFNIWFSLSSRFHTMCGFCFVFAYFAVIVLFSSCFVYSLICCGLLLLSNTVFRTVALYLAIYRIARYTNYFHIVFVFFLLCQLVLL